MNSNNLSEGRWIGERIWLYPPDDNPQPWIEKLLSEVDDGTFVKQAVVLVNNETETPWFQSLVSRYPVCFPNKRTARLDDNGVVIPPSQGQAIFYIGPNIDGFVKEFSQFGPVLRRID